MARSTMVAFAGLVAFVGCTSTRAPISSCDADGKACLTWLAPEDAMDATGAARVSSDGRVVVGRIGRSDRFGNDLLTNPFIWSTERGVEKLDPMPGTTACLATAISADGMRFVGDCDLSTDRPVPFQWTAEQYVTVAGLDAIADASGDMRVFLGTVANAPALSVNGTMMPLGDPSLASGHASPRAISDDGTTVVGSDGGFESSAPAFWRAGTEKVIRTPGSSRFAAATAVSADGGIIVGFFEDDFVRSQAFRWTLADGAKEIGDFTPTACSADGAVVVGTVNPTPAQGPSRAWVLDEVHGARDLAAALEDAGIDLAGATLDQANDVSAGGRVVVGRGVKQRRKLAFRAVLP
jgi:uncharacterized membrane protein